MWIALGILAWILLSLPIGIIVGHVLKRRTTPPKYCHPSFGCDCDCGGGKRGR
jgi:hypothetical protein